MKHFSTVCITATTTFVLGLASVNAGPIFTYSGSSLSAIDINSVNPVGYQWDNTESITGWFELEDNVGAGETFVAQGTGTNYLNTTRKKVTRKKAVKKGGVNTTVVDWSFTDGHSTWDSMNSVFSVYGLVDGIGTSLTTWYMDAETNSGSYNVIGDSYREFYSDDYDDYSRVGECINVSTNTKGNDFCSSNGIDQASSGSIAGRFSVQVPEPTSLALFGLGLLGIRIARRKFSSKTTE